MRSGKLIEEVAVTKFKILSRHLSGGAEEARENLCQNNECLSRDSNRTPPKYKSDALSLEPDYS
jgi:hypothetical protein